jgi:hypothetical protein
MDLVDLDLNHVRVIVRGMTRVAEIDGAHERELVLIREFYESCRAEVSGLSDFADVAKGAFDPVEAKEVISTQPLQLAFLTSCYLVAYADGSLSEAEKKVLAQLEKELGIPRAVAEQAHDFAKDQLLAPLARSKNIEGVKKIAGGL